MGNWLLRECTRVVTKELLVDFWLPDCAEGERNGKDISIQNEMRKIEIDGQAVTFSELFNFIPKHSLGFFDLRGMIVEAITFHEDSMCHKLHRNGPIRVQFSCNFGPQPQQLVITSNFGKLMWAKDE